MRHADTARLRGAVETLAGQPRPAETPALNLARDWVEARLREAGWQVRRETFTAEGLRGVNLIAELAAPAPDRPVFLVSAHLDSRPETPGADDNASAVAALLEMARLVRHDAETASVNLQLLVSDLEERGMLGAAHRADRLLDDGAGIAGMVSLEMLGYCDPAPGSQNLPLDLAGLYPDVGDFIGVVGNERSADLIERFAAPMRRIPGLKVETLAVAGNGETFPPTRLSDHSPFWDRGLPALMVTDTSFFRNPHYHQPTDTPETLDYDFLTQVTEGAVGSIRAILAG